MALITLFSAPKPFTDPHIAMIQRNAIRSWTLLPEVEVILLGEEDGLAQAAKEFGVKHLPNVERNESGTPLISSMFELARENSTRDLLCIVNTDMILMSDFVESAKACRSRFGGRVAEGVSRPPNHNHAHPLSHRLESIPLPTPQRPSPANRGVGRTKEGLWLEACADC